MPIICNQCIIHKYYQVLLLIYIYFKRLKLIIMIIKKIINHYLMTYFESLGF